MQNLEASSGPGVHVSAIQRGTGVGGGRCGGGGGGERGGMTLWTSIL